MLVKQTLAVFNVLDATNRSSGRLKTALAQSAFLGRKRGLAGGAKESRVAETLLKIYPLLWGLWRRERLEPDG